MTPRDSSSGVAREVRLDRSSPVPLYVQVRDALLAEVEAGRLSPGARLPSVRDLARRLRLNVNTVVSAYRLLEEGGTVEAHAAKGTFVRRAPGREPRVIPAVSPEAAARVLPGGPRRLAEVGPPEGLRPGRPAAVVGLSRGTPAPDLFPVAEVRSLMAAVLDDEGAEALQYGPADGEPTLRAAAAAALRAAGLAVEPDDLLVTTGAQQAIDLVARALLGPGDTVVVEAPTYPGALETFERTGCRVVPVPMTPRGPDPARLAAALDRHRPRLVYTVPTFHNPTGWTMDAATRERLVDLAARAGVFVLEDDHVADLAFDEPPPPALGALDREGRVIHVRGFAKTVVPGLRLAVVAAPASLRAALLGLKLAADLYAPPLEQRVLARFLAGGGYAAHVERIRHAYRARRDLALAHLARRRDLAVEPPGGGLNVWVGLPEGVAADALEREALAAGVAVAPGGLFYPDRRKGDHFVRVSYGTVTEPALALGLDRLGEALDRVRRTAHPSPALPVAVPLV